MVIIAKYRGTCRDCGSSILRGEQIEWSKAAGAAHVKCATPAEPRKPDGACWKCKSPEGRFRSMGAFTPVWCDDCHKAETCCKHCGRTKDEIYKRCLRCCPTCGGAMSAAYAKKGYQCDGCADRAEGKVLYA